MSSQIPEGSVFGLRIRGIELPGLLAPCEQDGPAVVFESAGADEINRRWRSSADAIPLFTRTYQDRELISVRFRPDRGYRTFVEGLGDVLVDRGGKRVWSYLEGERWRALRLLASQIYPQLALLNGRELIHAGSVSARGKLLAISAPSGTGKTSTLVHLLDRGCDFFSDDAVAVEIVAGELRAYPGPRVVALDREQHSALPSACRQKLGAPLDGFSKLLFEPTGRVYPQSLECFAILQRGPTASLPTTTIEPLATPAASLIGTMSLPWLRTRARVIRQLDVASLLEERIPAAMVTIGTEDGPTAVADRLLEWAEAAPTAPQE